MRDRYDFLYLSPHLDDVALSCGAQIHRHTAAGEAVLIVTIMAGDAADAHVSAYAAGLHERWALPSAVVGGRRAEDEAAAAILGAEVLHMTVPDCIYRLDKTTGEAFYTSDEALFGPVHPRDHGLVEGLEQSLAALPPAGQVIAPLGTGNHVDHQLTHLAARQLFGAKLLYYEEFPYAAEEGAVARALGPEPSCWEPRVVTVGADDLEARIQAILTYRSQLSTFFADEADLRRQILGYAAGVGGERLWRRLPEVGRA